MGVLIEETEVPFGAGTGPDNKHIAQVQGVPFTEVVQCYSHPHFLYHQPNTAHPQKRLQQEPADIFRAGQIHEAQQYEPAQELHLHEGDKDPAQGFIRERIIQSKAA